MEQNKTDRVVINRPKTSKRRRFVAQACCGRLNMSMPCVVDTMDNEVDALYAGWPERLFVIDRNGRIAYAGKQGPWGFKPKEAESALRRLPSRESGYRKD
jgi:hypothetical protein